MKHFQQHLVLMKLVVPSAGSRLGSSISLISRPNQSSRFNLLFFEREYYDYHDERDDSTACTTLSRTKERGIKINSYPADVDDYTQSLSLSLLLDYFTNIDMEYKVTCDDGFYACSLPFNSWR